MSTAPPVLHVSLPDGASITDVLNGMFQTRGREPVTLHVTRAETPGVEVYQTQIDGSGVFYLDTRPTNHCGCP